MVLLLLLLPARAATPFACAAYVEQVLQAPPWTEHRGLITGLGRLEHAAHAAPVRVLTPLQAPAPLGRYFWASS